MGNQNDNIEALPELKSRAGNGDAIAQYELATRLSEAPVPDHIGAFSWFKKAAEAGHLQAQYSLGVRYLNGQGTDPSLVEAVRWLNEAAERGHPGAQDSMGVRYATGQGVMQDDAIAMSWFLRAASQGHPVAQFNLGLAYAQGRGGPVDMVKAYAWLCMSAEQGDAIAGNAVETVVESLSLAELREARAAFHQLRSATSTPNSSLAP